MLSEDQSIHREVAEAILKRHDLMAMALQHDHYARGSKSTDPLILISIGTRACDKIMASAYAHDLLICTLIPAQSFNALLDQHQAELEVSRVTAVFMDQPISRQIALARLIVPSAQAIGTVFGRVSVAQRQSVEKYAEEAGLQVYQSFLDDDQNPVQVLTPIIQRSDVFLAIADSANFNRSVSRWALYISLRNKIPLIGFSSNYAEAGAVVSIFSTPAQIGEQTYQTVKQYLTTAQLTPPSYPNDFTVIVNASTARTLKLNLPSATSLEDQLKEIAP